MKLRLRNKTNKYRTINLL